MTGCPDDDALGALVAGGLSEAEREAIAIHAASCELCHAMLGDLSPSAPTADERDGAEELVLAPGTEVGRYTIESRIGAGGMGVVYRAIDRELERRVALKLLRPGTGERNARTRLVREARTLARLSHPNIVTVFDAGEHRGHVFVVMELIDGGNVVAWCAQRARTRDAILDCLLDAGRGLAAAHAAGVVHRDVKPDNILVGRDDRARVTDFGLARFELDAAQPEGGAGDAPATLSVTLTRTGTLLGTPIYMAPEVLRGVASPRTDQWAYCASLYELLAGVRPFPVEPGPRAVAIDAGRLAPPAAGRRIPAGVRAALARGLRADPAARWDSMTALVTALVRARRRPRMIAALAAVALVVGGGATAFALWEPARRPPELPPMSRVDQRDGCQCPYSACDGHCLGVCNVTAFKKGKPLPGISVKNVQEVLQGATERGDTVLYLSGGVCDHNRLFIAHLEHGTYVPVELTDQIDPALELYEGCCTISRDGHTLVVAAKGYGRFYQSQLDGDRVLPPTLLFDAKLPADAALRTPVLTSDGLTLYYRVEQHGPTGLYDGPLDGIYQAERDDVGSPFERSQAVLGAAHRYDYVSGVSSDNLSLFMVSEFSTRVLVRSSIDEPFGDPGHTLPAATIYGWRAIPIEGCQRVLVTWSTGGCHSEDITFIEPMP